MRTIAEINEDITAATAARRAILTGAQSYSFNDGQGSQQVTRASLSELNDLIKDLTSERERVESYGATDCGILAGEFSGCGL